jgi:hypothetical protein
MDATKRLAKRHKRQVERARANRKTTEPDIRTPEQIEAARLASRPDLRHDRNAWPLLPSDSEAPAAAASDQPDDAAVPAKTEGSE